MCFLRFLRTKKSIVHHLTLFINTNTHTSTLLPLSPTCTVLSELFCWPFPVAMGAQCCRLLRGTPLSAHTPAICWCVLIICALAYHSVVDLTHGGGIQSANRAVVWTNFGIGFLVFTILCLLTLAPWARAYSASLLTFGTCLVTCWLAYRVDHLTSMTTAFMTTSWPTDLPPITSFTRIDALAETPQDLMGAWMFAYGLLYNTIQCSVACRIGIIPSSVCTAVYVLVFGIGPFLSANKYGSPLYTVVLTLATAVALFPTSVILTVQSTKIEHQRQVLQETQQRALAYQRAAQKADGVLNHILKNNVVDAQTCIELFFKGDPQAVLEHARDLLFRSTWWCRLREAVLRIVEGTYVKAVRNVSLPQFCSDLLVGRPGITLDCPSVTALLDPIACNIVLDNAITNALRHGCTENQELKLKVAVSNHGSSGALSFILINRAKADKPPLDSWSASNDGAAHASAPSPNPNPAGVYQYESVSTGLGLQHITLVASVCDMSAELWQEDAYVYFRLHMDSQVSECIATERGPTATTADITRCFPPNVHVLCIDDSPIARKAFQSILPNEIPGSVIQVFGKTLTDVAVFKRAVAERCDIAIVDQNLTFPGAEVKGTDLIKELLAAGYEGLACVRSANCTDADQKEYLECGAHCAIDKNVRWPEMVQLLGNAYANHMPRTLTVSTESSDMSATFPSVWNVPGSVLDVRDV